jgi:hypothetical protein
MSLSLFVCLCLSPSLSPSLSISLSLLSDEVAPDNDDDTYSIDLPFLPRKAEHQLCDKPVNATDVCIGVVLAATEIDTLEVCVPAGNCEWREAEGGREMERRRTGA